MVSKSPETLARQWHEVKTGQRKPEDPYYRNALKRAHEKHRAKKTHTKTMVVPGLYGNIRVWKHTFSQIAIGCDRVIFTGNLLRLDDYWVNVKNNSSVIQMAATYAEFVESNADLLVGPNEILALNAPEAYTDHDAAVALRKLWLDDEVMKAATVSNGRLITYGGLTHGEWVSIGRPQTAQEAADLLNEKYRTTLYQGECFKTSGIINGGANPIFADPIMELYNSWAMTPEFLPFDQVHTSGDLNNEPGTDMLDYYTWSPVGVSADAHELTSYGSSVTIKGQQIIGHDLKLDIKSYGPTYNQLRDCLILRAPIEGTGPDPDEDSDSEGRDLEGE